MPVLKADGSVTRLFMAMALTGWMPLAPGQAGIQAWTQTQISPGLHTLLRQVEVMHVPGSPIPRGARITQVHADRSYAGNADLQSYLCWNGTVQCIEFAGRSVNSDAFAGMAADQPMIVVHRPRAWRGGPKPVFVRSNVTVWYEIPAQPAKP